VLFFLALVVLPQVADAGPQAGVKTGDWARYGVGQHVTGNETLVKNFVAQYGDYANTSYVSLNITAVYGTNVSLTQSIHHINGRVVSSLSTVNVSIGVDPSNPPPVIMKDYPPTLSNISNGTFFGVPRTINTLNVNSASGNTSYGLRYSWDSDTGMLLSELFLYTVDASATNTATFTFSFAMTSTNLWHYIPPKNPPGTTPPGPFGLQFTELYALAGIIGSIAVGVVAFAMKRSPKSKGRSRTGARDSRRDGRDLNQKKSVNN